LRSWVGTGLGAKRGIFFKNAVALETSARIQAVVMDKTGPLARGEPEVTDVVAEGLPEADLLSLAAAVERESEHPLAEALISQAGQRYRGRSSFSVSVRSCEVPRVAWAG
jgi:P-type Cu2+ transporter